MMSFQNFLGRRSKQLIDDPVGDNSGGNSLDSTRVQAAWPEGTPVMVKSQMGEFTGVIKSVDPSTHMAIVLDDNQVPRKVPVALLGRLH